MNYYNNIKKLLISNEIVQKVKDYSKNKSNLITYYNVGKELFKAGKAYGENIIKKYSDKLYKDLGKKYSVTNLKYMRQFYLFAENSHAVRDQLTWTHYRELLKLKDINEINYYIETSIKYNLSYRELINKIKSKEYERLDEKTKNKLALKKSEEISDYIKDPIILKSEKEIKEEITEKMLKSLILEDISSFLLEIGPGFSFIKEEYKIKIGDSYNYIDLLLYNYIYNCFVVIELKATGLKKQHIGQIQVYMNYIDENVKDITQNKTIGVIICKEDNKLILKYSSDPRIFSTTYLLKK